MPKKYGISKSGKYNQAREKNQERFNNVGSKKGYILLPG